MVLALAVASPARADPYVGDLPIPAYDNSGATVWTGAHAEARIVNPEGASILNQGLASGAVVGNGGVIRNAPGARWDGDVGVGANVAGAKIVNEGIWNGVLRNAGGDLDNSGRVSGVENAAGVLANEGLVSGLVVNGGQAANNGTVGGPVVNSGILVNNGAGSIKGGLTDRGTTTNNGAIAGGVTETGAFTNNASGRVAGGFALNGGSAVNNGVVAGGVTQTAGTFIDNGRVEGGARLAGGDASFTVNGVLAGGAKVTAGSLIVNSAGVVEGDVANAGSLVNGGEIGGTVANAGSFVNNGAVEALRQTAGAATNNGVVRGGAEIVGGFVVNNGEIAGAARVDAAAALVDNGAIGSLRNDGGFTLNASGVVRGRLDNRGRATINGELAGGALDRGELTINASGHVAGGLTTDGGATVNAGTIEGGAVVRSGELTTSGAIAGGLVDAGLVKATGTISGPIVVTGKLVVGDGTPTGERLTLAPGSSVEGVVTLPVDLSAGRGNFLAAKGAALDGARLDLTGRLVNASGAYWGALSLSDAPIALTPEAAQALAAASGPLYAYAVRNGVELTQTINPGLGATAGQVALAAATAFAQALSPPPEPGRGAVSVWGRGLAAGLTLSGENNAGTGPAFDATKLSTRLGGAEIGLDFALNDNLRVGVAGGDVAGSVADRAGSGASARVNLPFVGGYAALTGLGFAARFEARYLALDMRLTDAPLAVFGQSQQAAGMSYGLQASYRLPAGPLFVEPEAGVSYTRLAVASEATNVGALSFGKAEIGLAHAGLRLGAEFSGGGWSWRPYVLGEMWREWRGGVSIAVPQGPTITPTGLAGFEQVGLGLNAAFAGGWSGYLQGAGVFGRRIAGLAATGGLKVDF